MSDINTPGDQGGMRRRARKTLQAEWDAPHCDNNLAKLKREVDKGWKHFWSKPGRVEPKDYSFRDLCQSQARITKKRLNDED